MATPLLLYPIAEGSSGTGPTAILDTSSGTAANATITYGASGAYTSVPAGDGFKFGGTGFAVTGSLGGTKVQTALAGSKTISVQVVLDSSGQTASYGTFVGLVDGSGNPIIQLTWNQSQGGLEVEVANDAAIVKSSFVPFTSGPNCVTVVVDTTQATAIDRVKVYVNGAQVTVDNVIVQIAQNTAIDSGGVNWSTVTAGFGNSSSIPSGTSALYFAAFYAAALASSDISSADTALLANNDANPNLTAPTINAQPVSQIVPAGSPASFTVSATGATGYQWYNATTGTAIGGATSATYTINPTAYPNQGATFYCLASNGVGSTRTNTVSLTLTGLSSDVFLYQGAASPTDVILRIPTQGGPTVVLVGGLSEELPGAPALTAVIALAGGLSLEIPGAAIATAIQILAGGLSEEIPGAPTQTRASVLSAGDSSEAAGAGTTSGTLSPAAGQSSEVAGAGVLSATQALAAGSSAETPGAPSTAGTGALAGGQTAESPGAGLLAAVQAIVAGLTQETPGASTIVQTAILASGQTAEVAGAGSLSVVMAPAGGESTEGPGASTLAALQALTAGLSSEAGGAFALVVAVVLAAGQSDEAPGAVAISGAAALAGGASEEAAGAGSLVAQLGLAGGVSGELAGATQVLHGLITLLLAAGQSEEAAGASQVLQAIIPITAPFRAPPLTLAKAITMALYRVFVPGMTLAQLKAIVDRWPGTSTILFSKNGIPSLSIQVKAAGQVVALVCQISGGRLTVVG